MFRNEGLLDQHSKILACFCRKLTFPSKTRSLKLERASDPLGGSLKHSSLGLTPQVSGTAGLEWGPSMAIIMNICSECCCCCCCGWWSRDLRWIVDILREQQWKSVIEQT